MPDLETENLMLLEEQKDIIVPISLKLFESMEKRLQKAEEINQRMLMIILEQSEHIRYLEAMSRVKRI
jgi:hypothetical protein